MLTPSHVAACDSSPDLLFCPKLNTTVVASSLSSVPLEDILPPVLIGFAALAVCAWLGWRRLRRSNWSLASANTSLELRLVDTQEELLQRRKVRCVCVCVGAGGVGLFVFVRDGHIQVTSSSQTLQLGRGETGFVGNDGRAGRPFEMPLFIQFDRAPLPNSPNPTLLSILGQRSSQSANLCR